MLVDSNSRGNNVSVLELDALRVTGGARSVAKNIHIFRLSFSEGMLSSVCLLSLLENLVVGMEGELLLGCLLSKLGVNFVEQNEVLK